MGLTEDQVNEIAKLPAGVAVVYQNNWVSPILTLINKADVKETPYKNMQKNLIKPLKQSRSELIRALMQPWLKGEGISKLELEKAIRVVDLSREERKLISGYVDDYAFLGRELFWDVGDIPKLQTCLRAILHISEREFDSILFNNDPEMLRAIVRDRTVGFGADEIDEICNVLTKVGE